MLLSRRTSSAGRTYDEIGNPARFHRTAVRSADCAAGGWAGRPQSAFLKDARILFRGDSITDGGRGRDVDPDHMLGHGYVVLIAAKFGAAFPEMNLDFINRGVGGNTVLDLKTLTVGTPLT